VNEIKSTEVSWTMGKMLLYASAEISPASEDDLPVGFGSNVPGIPVDFQYPGGGRLQSFPDQQSGPPDSSSNASGDGAQSITDQIHSTLFKSDAPHRLPGFIFFLLILIIAAFYMCGRERRKHIYHSIRPSSPASAASHAFKPSSPPRLLAPLGFLNRLMNGRRSKPYTDHDLEDGSQRLYSPDDFELDNMSDDSLDADRAFSKSTASLSSRPASSHGRNSPTSKRHGTSSPGKLRPAAIDRAGLVVRTESRESLATMGVGGRNKSKSRSGSPTRLL